jgi:O-antigen/teichoic acid export membrane protein
MIFKGIRARLEWVACLIRLPSDRLEPAGRVGKNTVWLLCARLGSQGLMLVFSLVIAARLGEAGLGAYAFMTAVVFLGNVFTSFGTDMLILRAVAAARDVSLIPTALILQLILSVFFITLVFVVGSVLPNQSRDGVLGLQVFSLALIPMAFYTVFSAALRGYERMDSFMWLNLLQVLAQLGLVWAFIRPGSSLLTLAALLLCAQTAAALLAAYFYLTRLPAASLPGEISYGAMIHMLNAAAPLAFLSLLKVLYQKINVFMLSVMAGAEVTGHYSAALRPVEALQVGHVALLGALFPVMARSNAGRRSGKPHSKDLFSLAWGLLLVAGGVIAAGLFLSATPLVNLLFGPEFTPAIPALRLLAWTLIPFSVNIYLSSELLSAGQDRKVAFALSISLLLLFSLNLAWIPRWGLLGASLAAFAAEAVQAGIFIYLSRPPADEFSQLPR